MSDDFIVIDGGEGLVHARNAADIGESQKEGNVTFARLMALLAHVGLGSEIDGFTARCGVYIESARG